MHGGRQRCVQMSRKLCSRKYSTVMMPYVSTKTGILLSVLSFSLSSSAAFSALVSLPPSFSLSPSQSPLWCLRLIVLRGVEVMWVYCWHWIAKTESEMTKPPFSCLLSSPVSNLTAFITLNIIILWKKRKETTNEIEIVLYVQSWNNIEKGGEMIGTNKNKNHKAVCSLGVLLNMWDVL